jgi:phosphocarrier protein
MPTTKLTIKHEVGLHARPAALFVKNACSFPCSILVRNVTKDSKPANAKSILGILTLGVTQGNEIEIETSGEQADEALASLTELIESNFGE